MGGATGARMRRIGGVVAAVAVLAFGPWGAAQAEHTPLPHSCDVHPVHVVNPGCAPAVTSAVGEAVDQVAGPLLDPGLTYPNLQPNVTYVQTFRRIVAFDPATGQFVYGPPELQFDTHAENHGEVAIDLLNDDPANVENPAVAQCVAWTGDVCRRRERVGGFELHHTHEHFHFQNFARYTLRALLPDGSPDWSDAGVLGRSDKVSFCLVDSRRHRATARPVPVYVLCSSVREGISAGWTDVYTVGLPGQEISLAGLTDGRYALVVEMNYARDLFETDYDDNRIVVTVEVSNDRRAAAIVGTSRG